MFSGLGLGVDAMVFAVSPAPEQGEVLLSPGGFRPAQQELVFCSLQHVYFYQEHLTLEKSTKMNECLLLLAPAVQTVASCLNKDNI